MAKKVLYKNHCTPQEQISSGGRYYLDSDCGRKLTGAKEFDLGTNSTTYETGVEVDDNPAITVASAGDFVFIKNLGGGNGSDVEISLNGNPTTGSAEYTIKLSSGEAMSVELRADNNVSDTKVLAKCKDAGQSTTIEYLIGT